MSRIAAAAKLAGQGLALGAAGSLAILPVMEKARAQTVGINAAIRNQVEIRAAGARQPQRAVLRQRVNLNDEVRTGGDSRLQILLLDRSVFTVGPNARLTIDRFVYDPRRGPGQLGASVSRGAFRFLSGRSLGLPTRRASVRTPVATIGIRGTIVEGVIGDQAIDIARGEATVGSDVAADPGAATLIILRGPGRNAQGDTSPGAIDVQSGEALFALDRPSLALFFPRPGQPPIGPFAMSPEGLARVHQMLFPFYAPRGPGPGAEEGVRPEDSGTPARPTDRSRLPLLAAVTALLIGLAFLAIDDSDPASP